MVESKKKQKKRGPRTKNRTNRRSAWKNVKNVLLSRKKGLKLNEIGPQKRPKEITEAGQSDLQGRFLQKTKDERKKQSRNF